MYKIWHIDFLLLDKNYNKISEKSYNSCFNKKIFYNNYFKIITFYI